MHALVAPVLFRVAWLDAFRLDAELYPPDGEGRKSACRHRGEGRTVVRADGKRQTVFTKYCLEDGTDVGVVRSGQRLAA